MTRLKRRRNANIVINNQTRLFLKRAQKNCCCSNYEFHSCIAIGDLSQNKPEKQKIYCPSPNMLNEFIVVAEVSSSENTGSGSFSTDYNLDNSILEDLYAEGCLFDAQIHIGKCSDPSNFAQFERIIMLEGVEVTNYNLANIFAKEASEVGVVTENVDFKFETMFSYTAPRPTVSIATLLADGPIIDSFTNCDTSCCLCPNQSGVFLVQLAKCNLDCGCAGGECVKPRILYKTDSTWRLFNLPYCDAIDCATPVNRNVMQGNGGNSFNYVYLTANAGSTLKTTLGSSVISIPASILSTGEKLISADGCGNTVMFVGTTAIVRYDTTTKSAQIYRNSTLPLSGISYNSVSVCDNCETAFIGADKGRVLEFDIASGKAKTYYLNNGFGIVHHVEAVSCCSFLAAVEDDLYYVCQGTVTKSANILGTVTALNSVDGTIVYAATIFHGVNMLWMSADGGQTFASILESSESGNVVTNISSCYDKPGVVNFAGYFNANGVTEAEFQTTSIPWACENFDGVLFE